MMISIVIADAGQAKISLAFIFPEVSDRMVTQIRHPCKASGSKTSGIRGLL